MMKFDLNAVADRYENELYNSIVPFWVRHSPDREHGGFYNLLDRDGSLYGTDKYLWMQWRAIYQFAKLHNDAPVRDPQWLELARSGFDFCDRHARAPGGGFFFQVSADGSSPMRGEAHYSVMVSSYAAMASSQLFRATGEECFRAEAERSLLKYAADMRDFEGKTGIRKFGMYMHLCCAATEVLAALGQESGAARRLLRESLDRLPSFRHEQLHFWLEGQGPDGSFDLGSPMGRLVITGHSFETLWFMAEGAELLGDREVALRVPAWTREVCATALDPAGGVLFMQDAQERPLIVPGTGIKSWWSQCEGLLALAYAAKLSGDAWFLEEFLKLDAWTWKHFRDPEYPEWFTSVTAAGLPVMLAKGGPTKTFFHLPRCLFYCAAVLRSLA